MSFHHLSLNGVHTDGKPGVLYDVNISKILGESGITFNCTKTFYITELNSRAKRGCHSNSNVKEAILVLQGTCTVKLHDGTEWHLVLLRPNEILFVNRDVWIELSEFKNTILLVYVDIEQTAHKESCYDFEEFIARTEKGTNKGIPASSLDPSIQHQERFLTE